MATDQAIAALLEKSSPEVRRLALELRKLVRESIPEAEERVQKGWGTISYVRNGIFCYIQPQKSWVNLGFYRGTELPDTQSLLEGDGKNLRHTKVHKIQDIKADAFKALLEEALRLGGKKSSK